MKLTVRNAAKAVAARRFSNSKGKVSVTFPLGTAGLNHESTRSLKPIVNPRYRVAGVQCFGGLWLLEPYVFQFRDANGPFRGSDGRAHSAFVRFRPVHVLWLDENPVGSKLAKADAITRFARLNQSPTFFPDKL